MKLTIALKHLVARTRRPFGEDGQDLLEYALLVALIALVAIAAVAAAGGSVSTIFQTIAGARIAPVCGAAAQAATRQFRIRRRDFRDSPGVCGFVCVQIARFSGGMPRLADRHACCDKEDPRPARPTWE